MGKHFIHNGDVLETLSNFDSSCFDGILCDPPYGLSFMGKSWDRGVPSVEVWSEVFRVLKPGAFLLAFGGTRTFHRLTCAIEDAGFEIRDCVSWLYGSGFPKSHDISKGMDKAAGAVREPVGIAKGMGKQNPEWNGTAKGRVENSFKQEYSITAPATDAAKEWDGYGTALKPAWEPCIVAMKPTEGTFAENAMKYGVSGLNIESGRIVTDENLNGGGYSGGTPKSMFRGLGRIDGGFVQPTGRWPANLILDETFEQEWSRFFYCAKVSRRERNEGTDGNAHPCLKPIDLCRYLAGLILPPKRNTPRRILVPFSGSGSEMIGALQAGWDEAIGVELEPEYVKISNARLANWCGTMQDGLFSGGLYE